jgi:hypothetical protein
MAMPVEELPEKLERRFNVMTETGFDGRGQVKVHGSRGRPDLPYRLFIKSLGDDRNHTGLKLALASVDNPAAKRFLHYLFDARRSRTPVETLAKMAGVGIPQLRQIWRQARLDEGFLCLLNAYPGAMKDVALDARSTREICKPCGGTGKLVDDTRPVPMIRSSRRNAEDPPPPVLITCANCQGKGWMRKSGDKDARLLMGQILGVSGKPAPLVNSTVTNITLESVINDIELMTGSKGIYDATATVVPEPEPAA